MKAPTLGDVASDLEQIQAVIGVVLQVIGEIGTDQSADAHKVLMRCGADPLYRAIQRLRAIADEVQP